MLSSGFSQICFRLFRLLLLYHHPRLCRFLDQYQLQPELYATPWFMTLFSNSLDLPRLYEVCKPGFSACLLLTLTFFVPMTRAALRVSPVLRFSSFV